MGPDLMLEVEDLLLLTSQSRISPVRRLQDESRIL
jgi:hypothetical protein